MHILLGNGKYRIKLPRIKKSLIFYKGYKILEIRDRYIYFDMETKKLTILKGDRNYYFIELMENIFYPIQNQKIDNIEQLFDSISISEFDRWLMVKRIQLVGRM